MDKSPDVRDLVSEPILSRTPCSRDPQIVNELAMLNEQNSQLKEENLKLGARLKEQEEEKMALSAEQVSHWLPL